MSSAKTSNDSQIIEQAIFRLLTEFAWYGALVQSLKISLTSGVQTAGVCFDKDGDSILLAINPVFFASLTPESQVALLIHECSHIDRLHLIRIPEMNVPHKVGNIAADLAINCWINHLPEGGLIPKQFRMPNLLTTEDYAKRLMDLEPTPQDGQPQDGDGQPQDGDGQPRDGDGQPRPRGGSAKGSEASRAKIRDTLSKSETLDHHDWFDSNLSTPEKAELIEKILTRAAARLSSSSAGSIPAHVGESLKVLKTLKVRKWHAELKKFISRRINSYESERTWSRRNRRYGFLDAGRKTSGAKKLAIAIDTSGSMPVNELEQALAETISMLKLGNEAVLIQFDMRVNKVESFKRNTPEIKITNRGGTCFADLMTKIDAMKCDGLIVFTDGEDTHLATKPRTPVVFVYTTGKEPAKKYPFGVHLKLDR